MATQQAGLFTQGPSVEDLLQKRNTRAANLQQQLMAQAAQGSRTPAKARAFSLLGSSLGRALSGAVGGGQDQQLAEIRAKQAAQKGLQEQALTIGVNGTSVQQAQLSQDLHKAGYMQAAVDMANKSKATRDQEAATLQAEKQKREDALAASVENEDLQERAGEYGTALATWNPQLAQRLLSGEANDAEVSEGLKEMTAMNKSKKASTDGKSTHHFNKVGNFVDGQGNMYAVTNSINNVTEEQEAIYTPIGSAPEYAEQDLSPVNTSGLTQAQRVAATVAEKEAELKLETFYKQKGNAATSIGKTTDNLTDVTRMITILDKIKTGGFTVELGKSVSDWLGTTPSNTAEFANLSKTLMLNSLKAMLGGQLSDGERKAAEDVQASLKKGKGVNKAILTRLQRIFESKRQRELKVLDPTAKPNDYWNYLISQSQELTAASSVAQEPSVTEAPKTIQWGVGIAPASVKDE
jgi:hypothetical protein